MNEPTPRINHGLLGKYVGHSVRLVGRVKQPGPNTAVVEASDGRDVTVHTLAQTSAFPPGIVEVVGVVNADLSVRELWSGSLGEAFDMANYNDLVLIAQKLPAVF